MLNNVQRQLCRSQLKTFVASNAAVRTLSTIPPTDFCVVGGGIIGVTVAAELRKQHPDSRITLLEKESEVSEHASGRNSGVLHAGFYYHADSLKARLTRQGNIFLHEYCEEKGLKLNKCGKLVVARNEAELEGLEELFRRAKANDVPVERVTESEARELEPLIKTHKYALWSPTTAAADPTEVTRSLAKDASDAGVDIRTNTAFMDVESVTPGSSSGPWRITTSQGTLEAKHIVNCAGLYADKVAHKLGFAHHMKMLPFKGLYMYSNVPLKRLVYPVPNLAQPFLGVHFTCTVDGKVKIGPTAIPAFWREQYSGMEGFNFKEMVEILTTEASLFVHAGFDFRGLAFAEMRKYLRSYMIRGASELVTGVTPDAFTTYGRAGIRAQLADMKSRTLIMDFCLDGDAHSTHVLNAVSPAWTCAKPFAEHVVGQMKI